MLRQRSRFAPAQVVAVLALLNLHLFARAQDDAAAEGDSAEDRYRPPGDPVAGPTTTTTRNATVRSEYYECQTQTCSKWDTWTNVPGDWDNATEVCVAALDVFATGLDGFVTRAPQECRNARRQGFSNWYECKATYCKAYEDLVTKVTHQGGPMFFGGELCEPLLAFNRTICEEDYRDAEAFCDCICPTLELFDPSEIPENCQVEVFQYLLLGRRSPQLIERYPISGDCSRYLCNYFEQIGDPLPPTAPEVVGGVPGVCHALDLPFRRDQCRLLLTSQPYEPCPWLEPHTEDDELMCTDGTAQPVDIRNIDSWGICTDGHNFRKQCPANYPVMCAEMNCVGEGSVRDACCQKSAEECRSLEARGCSEALSLDLPEWHGKLTPNAAIRRITTTTLSREEIYMLNAPTSTYPPSLTQDLSDVFPWLLFGVAFLGIMGSVGVCVYLARQPHDKVRNMLLGLGRIMMAYKANRIMVYPPSGQLPEDKNREKLPYYKTAEAIEEEKAAAEATLNLESAHEACLRVGHNSLVSLKDPVGPMRCEANIRAAIAMVRQHQLELEGRNWELIDHGEAWLRTLEGERDLLQMYNATAPELQAVLQRTQPLSNGAPFTATRLGQKVEEYTKVQTWSRVEQLTESIKRAKEVNAGEALVRESSMLLAQILARMKELPADRCVLDPGGEGVKLLPQGTQRALYLQTGDPYLYRPDLGEADETGEQNVPREELGDISVDQARPVCAEYAKKQTCRNGRHCPWRHCIPKPGDTVRESIIWDDA